MKKRRLRIHNRILSWSDEIQAMTASITVDCPKCSQKTTYVPSQHGVGEQVVTDTLGISNYQKQKLTKLSDSYHASVRSITLKCPKKHSLSLLIIFDETQPARYVFVYVGVI